MANALQQLADRQIILASAEIEAELRSRNGGPLLEIWRRWRANAIDSLGQLVNLNIHDPNDRRLIVTHQNEVKRYIEYAHALAAVYNEGLMLERELTAQERRDLIEIIKGLPENERAMIDLGPDGNQERDAAMD